MKKINELTASEVKDIFFGDWVEGFSYEVVADPDWTEAGLYSTKDVIFIDWATHKYYRVTGSRTGNVHDAYHYDPFPAGKDLIEVHVVVGDWTSTWEPIK